MIMNRILVSIVLVLVCFCFPTQCARILGVFPFAATSHYTLGNSLMKGLAAAGHDVTMISPFEENNPPKNGSYRNIVLTGFAEDFEKFRANTNLFESNHQSLLAPIFMVKMLSPMAEKALNHTNVKRLLDSGERFDVVIVEQFVNDAMKLFANHFHCPLILLSTVGANSWVNMIAGNPSPPAYVPHMLSSYPARMTFFQRVGNVIKYMMDNVLSTFVIMSIERNMAKKYFPDGPDLLDVYHDASIILLNSHESLNQALPLVPNMVEIGGYHVAPPKKLPQDLQEFLDNAKEGVVYFSLGSNLRSKDLPPEKRDMFLKALGKLKQKVLWKWETDVLPGQPANVKLGKWFPQQDILAHPNVKVFITHGGLLSTTETVYHGVPVLAIPVFGDQHRNARNAERNGFALSLPYKDPNFSEEKLSELLKELLTNQSYTENVKRRSRIFHDRPLKPMDTAVYWVEYVIRHKDTSHLRVAGATLPLYKYLLLDVIAFLAFISIAVVYILGIGLRYLLCRRRNKEVKKIKKN
uniref:UDP-glucuronosyltransferase n=1 Tax=Xylotrechus quadripes TaxID=554073 RepID=A0A6G7SF99_9CUCU|nr:UDP-glycosyltransferase [Xylotrechus quadripes]